MMQRLECLRAIYGKLEDCLVVTIMGAVAASYSPWDISQTSSTCSMPWDWDIPQVLAWLYAFHNKKLWSLMAMAPF